MFITVNGRLYATVYDNEGVQRYPENKLFVHLVDSGRVDLNELARDYLEGRFPQEEYLHFLMGLGYSVSGLCDLNWFEDLEIDNPSWKEAR